MPARIVDDSGETVEVLTSQDLTDATWRLIRWAGGTIVASLVAATLWVQRTDARVTAIEQWTAARAIAIAEDGRQSRVLVKTLDSLVTIIGVQSVTLSEQSATLKDISRRLK